MTKFRRSAGTGLAAPPPQRLTYQVPIVNPDAMSTGDGDDLYGAAQVTWLADITYKQLDYWVRHGVIVPAVPAFGSGADRLFTLRQVHQARLLGRLALFNARTLRMRAVIAEVEARPELWHEVVAVTGDGDGSLPGLVVRAATTSDDCYRIDLVACELFVLGRLRESEGN